MFIPKYLVVTGILTMFMCSAGVEAVTYKWVDDKGDTHFSDMRPSVADFEKMPEYDPPSRDTEAQLRVKRLLRSQEKSKEVWSKKVKTRKIKVTKKLERAKNCRLVRDQFAVYKNNPARRIFVASTNGEQRRLTEDEKQIRLAELKKQIMDSCK